ncbi:helix-turn-helix transcriptional regulator, partial [Elstera litoralis]|uniref:helix-turn-helix transcriptional regulator n=1 Tax=Elstera litoralis TaxID=552518 RepID=UPI000695E614
YDLLFRDGLCTEGYSEPSLMIAALIDGDGEGYLIAEGQHPGGKPIRYAANTVFLHYADVRAFGGYRVETNSRFRMVEMRLSLDFLGRLGLAGQFDHFDAAHSFHLVSTDRIWVGSTQMADNLRQLTLDLIAMADAQGSDLQLEARALDLLAKTVDLFQAAGRNRSVGNSRHQRDRRCLERARDIILADPAHLWTIRDLARQVGMNEKKLKETFREYFGQPIRGFQQENRLKRGRDMLIEGTSVTETSLAVGFSNPSYFAYLFQRQYGVAPSALLTALHA